MPAIDQRLVGQVAQALEARPHRPGRPLEHAAHAQREQGIGRKQMPAFAIVEHHMAQRVARHGHDLETGFAQRDGVTIAHQLVQPLDLIGLFARTDDAGAEGGLELGDGLDVIDMMVGDEDIGQRPAAMQKGVADRPGLRRVDGSRAAGGFVMYQIAEIVAAGGKHIHDQAHRSSPFLDLPAS